MASVNDGRCPECGQLPGECYFICPNSPAFYSPEQERRDDAFYGGDDHAERYAAERRELDGEYDEYDQDVADDVPVVVLGNDADIPF